MRTYLHYLFEKLKAALKDEESRGTFLVCFWLFCLFAGLVLMCINSFFQFTLGFVWIVPAIIFCAIGFAPFVFIGIVEWRQYLHWTLELIRLPLIILCWLHSTIRNSFKSYRKWIQQENNKI